MTLLQAFLKSLFSREEPIPHRIHELAETYGRVKMPDGKAYVWDEQKKRAVRDDGEDNGRLRDPGQGGGS